MPFIYYFIDMRNTDWITQRRAVDGVLKKR